MPSSLLRVSSSTGMDGVYGVARTWPKRPETAPDACVAGGVETAQPSHFPPPRYNPLHPVEQSGGLEVPSSNLGAPTKGKPRRRGAFSCQLVVLQRAPRAHTSGTLLPAIAVIYVLDVSARQRDLRQRSKRRESGDN